MPDCWFTPTPGGGVVTELRLETSCVGCPSPHKSSQALNWASKVDGGRLQRDPSLTAGLSTCHTLLLPTSRCSSEGHLFLCCQSFCLARPSTICWCDRDFSGSPQTLHLCAQSSWGQAMLRTVGEVSHCQAEVYRASRGLHVPSFSATVAVLRQKQSHCGREAGDGVWLSWTLHSQQINLEPSA